MAIIVLEGPDMAGKTTLANGLRDTLTGPDEPHVSMLRQGPLHGDPLEAYLMPLSERHVLLSEDRVTLIMDRWHLGELVYGPLLRGGSRLTDQQADYIDMVLQSFGCTFLYVTAPLRVLEDRYDIRGDGLIKKDQLNDIHSAYEVLMNRRTHWVMHAPSYGFTTPGFPVRTPSPRAGQYIGPKKPSILLLGDERASCKYLFPFVPARATSGHWLMGALAMGRVDHMQVGLMNACEVDPGILFAQWFDLGKPPIVTLGRNAQRAWNIAHQGDWKDVATYLHHPQYMRRFHYTSMPEYGKAIREAIDGR